MIKDANGNVLKIDDYIKFTSVNGDMYILKVVSLNQKHEYFGGQNLKTTGEIFVVCANTSTFEVLTTPEAITNSLLAL